MVLVFEMTDEWVKGAQIKRMQSFDGLVQDCNNSIANALELLQSCTKSSN